MLAKNIMFERKGIRKNYIWNYVNSLKNQNIEIYATYIKDRIRSFKILGNKIIELFNFCKKSFFGNFGRQRRNNIK